MIEPKDLSYKKVSKGTKHLLILFLCLSVISRAECTKDNYTLSDTRYEIGLFVSHLLPNRYPAFESPTYIYGLKLAARLWIPILQAQIGYVGQPGLKLTLGEVHVKVPVQTPYFSVFILSGPYWLYYFSDTNNDFSSEQWGIVGGLGFAFELSKNFGLEVNIKNYFSNRNLVGFSAGISYQL